MEILWKQFAHIFGCYSPETLQKLYVSTKFPHQEIRWNYGILYSFVFHVHSSKPNLELFWSAIFEKKKDNQARLPKNAEKTYWTVKCSLDWLHSMKMYLERAGKNWSPKLFLLSFFNQKVPIFLLKQLPFCVKFD